MNTTSAPLKLFLHGLDHRFIKTMMLFLQGPCQGAAMIVASPVDADIDLFDVDSHTSKNLLQSSLESRLTRPVIVLSLHDYHETRVLSLKKPINANDFQKVLAESRRIWLEASSSSAIADPVNDDANAMLGRDDLDLYNDDLFSFMEKSAWGNSPVPTISAPVKTLLETGKSPDIEEPRPLPIPEVGVIAEAGVNATEAVPDEDSVYSAITDADPASFEEIEIAAGETVEELVSSEHLPELERSDPVKQQSALRLDEKSYRTAIGLVDERDFDDPTQMSRAAYNRKEYFQGCFQAALGIARMKDKSLTLNSPWCQIALFPRSQEVWLTANDTELSTIACIRLRPKDIAGNISIKPVDIKSADIKNALDKFQSSQTFLWKLACWTSKGRFPVEIDLSQPVYLKHWPNFTRLLITPHALSISALLVQGPRTMDNIARVLAIKPQYVFIFISAAYAIGVAGQAKRLTDTLIQPPEIQATKKQSLLSNIMIKLRG